MDLIQHKKLLHKYEKAVKELTQLSALPKDAAWTARAALESPESYFSDHYVEIQVPTELASVFLRRHTEILKAQIENLEQILGIGESDK